MQLQYSSCTAVLVVITYLDNCSYGSAAAPALWLQSSETQVTCSSLATGLQCCSCSNLSQLYIILDNSGHMISDDAALTRGPGFPPLLPHLQHWTQQHHLCIAHGEVCCQWWVLHHVFCVLRRSSRFQSPVQPPFPVLSMEARSYMSKSTGNISCHRS